MAVLFRNRVMRIESLRQIKVVPVLHQYYLDEVPDQVSKFYFFEYKP